MELLLKLRSKYFGNYISKVSRWIYMFGCGFKSCINLLLNTDFGVLISEYPVTCGIGTTTELKPRLLLDAKPNLN